MTSNNNVETKLVMDLTKENEPEDVTVTHVSSRERDHHARSNNLVDSVNSGSQIMEEDSNSTILEGCGESTDPSGEQTNIPDNGGHTIMDDDDKIAVSTPKEDSDAFPSQLVPSKYTTAGNLNPADSNLTVGCEDNTQKPFLGTGRASEKTWRRSL